MAPRRTTSLALLLLTWAAAQVGPLPTSLSAQTVHGRLLEQGTARPIPSGLVTLLHEGSEEVDRTDTDSLGHFTLRSPDAGAFYIRAERIGYRTKTDGILEIDEGGEITISFYLRPDPVEIEGVEATGEPTDWIETNQRRFLEGQGFYRRMSAGFGHFITPEELEEDPPLDYHDVLAKIPGVLVRSSRGQETVLFRNRERSRNPYCSPAIYIDGLRTADLAPADVEAVSAVEVYTRISSVPLEYSVSRCGVVLIWTK